MGDMLSFRLLTDTFGTLADPAAPRPTPRPTPTPTPAPTVPAGWVEFTSAYHGFSIKYPPEWTAQPAWRWDADDVFFQGHNELRRGQNKLSIERRSVPATPFAVAWAEATLPKRTKAVGDHRHCVFTSGGGTMTIETSPDMFRPIEILGRPAAIRSSCSYVDAVIDLGESVLVLSQVSATRMPEGNEDLFARFVAGLRLEEDRR